MSKIGKSKLNEKQLIILVMIIIAIVLMFVGVSVAWLNRWIDPTGSKITITTDVLDVDFAEDAYINVPVGMPIYDETRDELGYKNVFTLSLGSKTEKACYTIALEIINIQDKFKSKHLKWELYDRTNNLSLREGSFEETSNGFVIDLYQNGLLTANSSIKYELRVWLSYSETEDQSELLLNNIGNALEAKIKVSSTSNTCPAADILLAQRIIDDNNSIDDSILDLTAVSSATNGLGLYNTSTNTENNQIVHYFRGDVTNNWVQFGKDETGSDLYWRIVRINEDGSIRLIYAGKEASLDANQSIGSSPYALDTGNAKYLGYMYGEVEEGETQTLETDRRNTVDSVIKIVIDAWYDTGIKVQTDGINTYDTYVSRTAVYCNDRTVNYGRYGANAYFGPYYRVNTTEPQFKCDNIRDSFSGINDLAYLRNPVALITADEIAYAGSRYNKAANTYLTQGTNNYTITHTMTPYRMNQTRSTQYGYNLQNEGALYTYSIAATSSSAVVPVLSLKSCVLYDGGDGKIGSDGTPYKVKINTNCVNSIN